MRGKTAKHQTPPEVDRHGKTYQPIPSGFFFLKVLAVYGGYTALDPDPCGGTLAVFQLTLLTYSI
jgi:hypothetical protein